MKNLNLKTKGKDIKGITLVSLVITIIILLILATVSISFVINNGILDKAKYAVDKYSDGEIEEQIKLAYLEWQTAQLTGTTENAETFIKNRLDEIFDNVEDVSVDNGKISVAITEGEQVYSYNYDISTGTTNKSYKNYVGYYADIDADGEVDGVIFADLLVGNTKGTQWGKYNGTYTIPTVNNDTLKKYYISQKKYEGIAGIKDVIATRSTNGKDRFYVMSLTDFSTSLYTNFYWYKNAYGNMSDYRYSSIK